VTQKKGPRARLEIDLDRFNHWHQPAHQLLMDGIGAVGGERGLVGELHHTSQLITLPARRDVYSDGNLHQTRDLALQFSNLGDHALFLLLRYSWLPAKSEHVDIHG
jgi:hypothetical protein